MGKRGFVIPTVDHRVILPSHGRQRPTRMILHTTESNDIKGDADALAIPTFWKNQGKGYGSHHVIDKEGITVRCQWDPQITYTTQDANTGSLQIEMVAKSIYSKKQWAERDIQIRQVAKWWAYWSRQYGIPLKWDTEHGCSTHNMQTIKHHVPGGHTDPGPYFPLEVLMQHAVWYKENGWYRGPGETG